LEDVVISEKGADDHIGLSLKCEHALVKKQNLQLIRATYNCRRKDFDFDVLMMPYDHDVLMP